MTAGQEVVCWSWQKTLWRNSIYSLLNFSYHITYMTRNHRWLIISSSPTCSYQQFHCYPIKFCNDKFSSTVIACNKFWHAILSFFGGVFLKISKQVAKREEKDVANQGRLYAVQADFEIMGKNIYIDISLIV